mmetsp:Transcript_45852/g.33600  ORF Transcript_45852/g.33600 Transcript_45852/m.33600 type:complete len:134 (+) Transcript_45852:360-761(+)
MTVGMVVYYYYMVEKVALENLVDNYVAFGMFVGVWHVVAMFCKNFEINRLKKNEKNKEVIIVSMIVVIGGTIIMFILWPILAAVGVEAALIETDYQKAKFIYEAFYIVLNMVSCALPLFNNFFFFISDGIILS